MLVWWKTVKSWILSIVTLFIFSANIVYAEKLATVLKGQVVANNPAGLRVMVMESDGSILDMTDTSAEGVYKLDLTVMDTPSQDEVKKLIVEVRDKSGTKKKIPVAKYLNIFDETVLLRPIILN